MAGPASWSSSSGSTRKHLDEMLEASFEELLPGFLLLAGWDNFSWPGNNAANP
jgi:hypothetical protein